MMKIKPIVTRYIYSCVFLATLWSCGGPELPPDVAAAYSDLPAELDYNIDVKPILSDRCFACHGPDAAKQKADLRLDTKMAYEKVAEGSGRRAVVPGKPEKSEMFHRIISDDPEFMMPLPESNLTLNAKEKAVLIKWIEDGAEYKEHWSLVPPKRPELPQVENSSWVKNPVDNFILAKLEQKELEPNQQAVKESLIRRVTFDLTGLPPTIDEIDAFLADESPNAYEKVVDRLLASPHYGERMATGWLDVARYADTHGYQDDGYRNSYPWRDWVISSFNENMPYDEFITLQLAGDLLDEPTKEQLIATSFLRNHPQSQEGGIVDEEYRIEYVADRVNVFGKALLAQSMECARCHDHKYDPISQKDYFQMFAFFNNNNETGEVPYAGEASPSVILTTPEVEEILDFVDNQLQPLEEKAADKELYKAGFEKWLANVSAEPSAIELSTNGLIGFSGLDEELSTGPGRHAPNEENPTSPVKLKPVIFSNQSGVRFSQVEGWKDKAVRLDGDVGITFDKDFTFDRHQPFSFSVWVKTFKPNEKGPLFGKTAGDTNGWRGYMCELNEDQTISIKLTHVYPANGIDLLTTEKLDTEKWHHLVLTYDGSSRASGVKLYIDGEQASLKVKNDNLRQSMLFARNNKNNGAGLRRFMLGREHRASVTNIAFDDFRAYNRPISLFEVQQLSGKESLLDEVSRKIPSELSASQREMLFEYYLLAYDRSYASLQQKLMELRGKENEVLTEQEEVMVYEELDEPRPTYILERGEYDAPTERVYPGTPESIMAFREDLPENRMGLAKWLTSEKNPLFARVAVNRLWQQCFGEGIVRTPDDFGNQGELPTHPKLLDWLSVEFRENGWNVKELLKMMVMSATYRQSSVPTPENKEADPMNHYLSRAPSYRMTAEMIRDNALAASGLLVRETGGRSVYPYQPPGVWEALAVRNEVNYTQSTGDDLYRRSLYTIWKRSAPHPAMTTFDVPDRYICTIERQKTSTPLQALVLMNDEQFVEAARVLAEKMIRKGGNLPEDQITYAFRCLTSRYPEKEELEILLSLYNEELNDFKEKPQRAEQLLSVGEYGRDEKLPAHKIAANAVIAHTVMNFDEFIMKR